MKKNKATHEAHTPNTKYGLGDYYGTGIPGKIGKMREGMGMQDISPKRLSRFLFV